MIKRKPSQRLRREQLDEIFRALRSRTLPVSPKKGWVREIREALGMSRAVFARRLSLDPSTVLRLEKSEAKKTITITSLQRLADALECDLKYVLIPKRSLSDMLFERAERILKKEEEAVENSMRLEKQGGKKQGALRKTFEIVSLIDSFDRRLWAEKD